MDIVAKLKPIFINEQFSIVVDSANHNRVIAVVWLSDDKGSLTEGLFEVNFLPQKLSYHFLETVLAFPDVTSALSWIFDALTAMHLEQIPNWSF